jgi:thiol-disulfide isomerase/thioredoxin
MSFIKDKIEESMKTRMVLLYTTPIMTESPKMPQFEFLKQEYKENFESQWVAKAAITMLNAIFTQNRAVFVTTRKSFRQLIKDDPNWEISIGLKNENWPKLIGFMIGNEIIKEIHKTEKGRSVYEVSSDVILEYLNINIDNQRKEAIEFAENEDEIKLVENSNDNIKIEGKKNKDKPVEQNNAENKLSFNELLKTQYPSNESITEKKLEQIVQRAKLNCYDFENDLFTVNTLIIHYFGKRQRSKKQKEFKELIQEKLEHLLIKIFAKDIKLVEPEIVDPNEATENEHTRLILDDKIKKWKKEQAEKSGVVK